MAILKTKISGLLKGEMTYAWLKLFGFGWVDNGHYR